jgi:hypothetical protein
MNLNGVAVKEINHLYLYLSVDKKKQGPRLLKLLSIEAVLKEKTWCKGPYAGVDYNSPYQLYPPPLLYIGIREGVRAELTLILPYAVGGLNSHKMTMNLGSGYIDILILGSVLNLG